MKRPPLNEIPLDQAFSFPSGAMVITMCRGQWDAFLDAAYQNENAILVELDDNELPVRAFRKLETI